MATLVRKCYPLCCSHRPALGRVRSRTDLRRLRLAQAAAREGIRAAAAHRQVWESRGGTAPAESTGVGTSGQNSRLNACSVREVPMMDLRERARTAARARWSRPEYIEARVDVLAETIRQRVDSLPPLSASQRAKLVAAIRGGEL
jgi:hypothetical protein